MNDRPEPSKRKIGGWMITLAPAGNVALPWRASATTGDWAHFTTGFDKSDALVVVAKLMGQFRIHEGRHQVGGPVCLQCSASQP